VVVRMAERGANVLDHRPRVAERHAAAKLLIQQGTECLAFQVLHQHVQSAAVDVHRVHVDDVRMAERARLADLLSKQGERFGPQTRLQDLDRKHLTWDLLIPSQIYDSHPTLAELALDT